MEISGLDASIADLERACSHGKASLHQAAGSDAVSVDASCARMLLLATSFIIREWQAIASSLAVAHNGGSALKVADIVMNSKPLSPRPDLAQIELMELASARITQLSTELEEARGSHAATTLALRPDSDINRVPHRICEGCEKVLDSVLRSEAAEIVSSSLVLHKRMHEAEAMHAEEREKWRTDALHVEYSAMVAEARQSEEEQHHLLKLLHAERSECAEAVQKVSSCDSSRVELRSELCVLRSAHDTSSVDPCNEARKFAEFGARASSDLRSENAIANGAVEGTKVVGLSSDARSESLEERVIQLSSELESLEERAAESESMRQECRSQAADAALLRVQLEATKRAGTQLKVCLDEVRQSQASPSESGISKSHAAVLGHSEGRSMLGLGAPKTDAEAEIIRRKAQLRGALLREELAASKPPSSLEEELAVERRRVGSLEESHEALRLSVVEASRRDAAAQRWAGEEAAELERLRLQAAAASSTGLRAESSAMGGALSARCAAVSALRAAVPQARAARMEVEELRAHLEEAASDPMSSPSSTKRLRSTRST